MDDVESAPEDLGQRFEKRSSCQMCSDWREGSQGRMQAVYHHGFFESDGGTLNITAKKVEGVGAMNNFDLMSGPSQQVCLMRDEHRVAPEVFWREEGCEKAEPQVILHAA